MKKVCSLSSACFHDRCLAFRLHSRQVSQENQLGRNFSFGVSMDTVDRQGRKNL